MFNALVYAKDVAHLVVLEMWRNSGRKKETEREQSGGGRKTSRRHCCFRQCSCTVALEHVSQRTCIDVTLNCEESEARGRRSHGNWSEFREGVRRRAEGDEENGILERASCNYRPLSFRHLLRCVYRAYLGSFE